ncbi:NAD(P)-dependent oxidoreductase [Adhaeribacter soli]|uniref:Phosphoglycerate dehydrogenase n=1 Tax=Adhaeribacter soli TaxID=2607655 RepID=A0A5N1J4L2_9BACT|nr:NAD(P)-dependent oxidoreductase [Adhaeribacter soli]KAA9345624.1 phosphoglycerate dehydrogenase [Adhaeribacter soli]
MKPFCLIIDQMHPGILPMLEKIGVEVSYRPDIKPDEVKAALAGVTILMVRSKLQITEDLLSKADSLKVIARAGAGIDNIDEAVLAARNIELINAPEGNRTAVGEFTLGLLLALFRNIVKADREVRNLKWLREPNRGEEIAGKTIGIIGYGNMGKSFARCLAGFDCRVLAYDTNPDCEYDAFGQKATLNEVFEAAEVLSLHIPYIPANYHFVNEQFLQHFQKPIWLLNTARGEVMDYRALVKGLKSGKIKGAALDVLENEKLAALTPEQQENFAWLSGAENVILTPHIAGWTHQSYRKINEVLVQKLQTVLTQISALR